MELERTVYVLSEAIKLVFLLSGPVLLACLGVGLIVSVLQAITQIQEITLSFVPKILAAFVTLAIFLPWMLKLAVNFTTALLRNTNLFIR
ncbi:TPA: flagellar biosynthesis protein FliQ [Candidatus Poribacteria bacterium]|nr:flagellar biosynthesis protein FliQ [Candidatus Poribacteria bacterium]HEX28602.1 flagellar biosynthesis protein FliQ [Candidatus Poribacteria bacterium]